MSELINFILDHEEAFSKSRLASLYADFARDARIDPDNYAANVEDWKNALYHAARAGRIPSSTSGSRGVGKKSQENTPAGAVSNNTLTMETGETLLRALEISPWGRPDSLGAVIRDAVDKRELIPLEEYMAATQSLYRKSWLKIPSPWQVVNWGLQRIGLFNTMSGQARPVGRFVCVRNVEAAGSALKARISRLNTTPSSRVYSVEDFTRNFADVQDPPLTDSDVKILLIHFSRDEPILSYDASRDTVKISPSVNAPPGPITENDASIAQVKSLLQNLETSISDLQDKIMNLERLARAAVLRKDTNQARNALRRKKLLAETLEKRRINHTQLEEIILAIDTAHDSAAMVRAMSQSAQVLRNLNKEVGGVETVDKITDRLREEMEKTQDIANVVTELGRESAAINEAEVDEEFEALERAERERLERDQRKADEERDRLEAERTQRRLERLKEVETDRKQAECPSKETRTVRGEKREGLLSEEELTKSLDRLKALRFDGENLSEQGHGKSDETDRNDQALASAS